MQIILAALALLGVILSTYLWYVDEQVKENKKYKATCDISKTVSCTGVAKSKYTAVLLGIPNALLGIIFYTIILIFTITDMISIVFPLAVLATIFDAYLLYLMMFKIKKYCPVCLTTYAVTLLILITSYTYL